MVAAEGAGLRGGARGVASDLLGLEWSGFGIKSTPVQITLGLASS